MKNIFFIALNTVKGIQSEKMFYILIVVFFLLIGMGVIAGNLSLNEQKRLSLNFAWTACHISSVFMALYFASHLIPCERERKTLLLILTKPVLRGEFIAGLFLGLVSLLFLFLCVQALFMLCVYGYYASPVTSIFFLTMSGIWIEALLLIAWAFLFSIFMPAFLGLVYSIFVFIIGHSVSDLLFFTQTHAEGEGLFHWGISALIRILPDLERLNWRAHALYQDPVPLGEWGLSMLYALCYTLFVLLIAHKAFSKRDWV